jgi:hypothetical protein
MLKSTYTALITVSEVWFNGAKIILSNHCTTIAINSLLVGQPIAAQS